MWISVFSSLVKNWGAWFLYCMVNMYLAFFSSVQFSRSVVSNSATPWITACQASLSITNSQSSLKLMYIESVMPSSHLILCHPLLLSPPIPPSIRVFSFLKNKFFFNYFTILYWFCHTLTWIRRRCTWVPYSEPPPTTLRISSLWVIPVHQPQASCILYQT